MKPITHIILLLMLSFTAHAQKVIVIDTVISKGYEHLGLQVDLYCGDSLGDCDFHDSRVEYIPMVSISNGQAYIVRPVPHLNYLSISIGFDDKYSKIILTGLEKLKGDTIHISKWSVYKNKLGSYVEGVKVFLRMENDSVLGPNDYRGEEFVRYNKGNGDTLREYKVTINGVPYSVPLSVTYIDLHTHFNGYSPVKVYNRYLKYAKKHDKPYKRKFRYDKFSGESVVKQYVYIGMLDLSTAP